MELQYLMYVGSKKEGTLNLKQVHALSPFRHLKYGPGVSWRIGIDMPEDVARRVIASYPTLFKIETEELSSEEVFRMQIENMKQNFSDISIDRVFAIVSEVFENNGSSELTTRKRIRRKKVERID